MSRHRVNSILSIPLNFISNLSIPIPTYPFYHEYVGRYSEYLLGIPIVRVVYIPSRIVIEEMVN